MTYRASQPFTCATCDVAIVGQPVFHLGLPFCCAGCAADGPCMCSYDLPGSAPVERLHHVVAAVDEALDDAVLEEPAAVSASTLVATAR